jgi:hypothetical protein
MPPGSGSYVSPYPQLGLRYGYGPPVGPPGSYGLISSYGQPGPMGSPMGGMSLSQMLVSVISALTQNGL